MSEPEPEIESLVATARDILAGRLDVLRGSSALCYDITCADIGVPPEYSVFSEVMMASVHLPVGPERQHWNTEVLEAKDLEIARLTELYRENVLDACRSLLSRLEQPTNLPP
jgi:hypothetical protein